MLIIKDSNRKVYEWHVGEPLPKMKGPVISFQADGDELRRLLAGLTARIMVETEEQQNLINKAVEHFQDWRTTR